MSATNLEIGREAYYASERMIAAVSDGDKPRYVVNSYVQQHLFDYDNATYARIVKALQPAAKDISSAAIPVSSIEAIKGLESERCLFILTPDLAPYLFGQKKQDNKMKHLLYVALTRSLDNLSILITKEVEKMYSKEQFMHLEKGLLDT